MEGEAILLPRRPRRALLAALPLVVLLLTAAAPAPVDPAAELDGLPAPPPPVVRYVLDVRLDPARHRLSGRERIVWRNPSSLTVDALYLHLYMNAFAGPETTFVRESGGQLRGVRWDPRHPGWIRVEGVRLEYVQPDDHNPQDRTLARLPLPRPVPPGGTATVDLSFEEQLPRVFARAGYAGDFVLAGQWFPKVAVLEPAGQRGRTRPGWELHQYHAQSEFYADYGEYDVRITLPASYTVGATGVQLSSSAAGPGWKRVRFLAQAVHDFAWTADPHFVVRERTFRAPGLPPVRVRLLLQPEDAASAAFQFRILEGAWRLFGRSWAPYPYPLLTVVDPPRGAEGAAGMEYPTLIVGGYPAPGVHRPEDPALADVLVHEYAHEYWYGLVGFDETEEAWLDEGLATYSEMRAMESLLPRAPLLPAELGLPEPAAPPGLPARLLPGPPPVTASGDSLIRLEYLSMLPPSQVQPAWRETDENRYWYTAYGQPGLFYRSLEAYLGRAAFDRALSALVRRYAWGHPSTAQVQAVWEEATGRPLGDLFRQFVTGARRVDYGIQSVRPVAGGLRVVVRHLGDGSFPVRIEAAYPDGVRRAFAWDGRGAERTFTFPGAPAEVRVAAGLALDVDPADDLWRPRPPGWPLARWWGELAYLMGTLLSGGLLW
ncbi:MAG: M1 family metallopeptidase [Clostridia bacterium]|nr:M1 family metallopeptidase [Clostridia bacterium]